MMVIRINLYVEHLFPVIFQVPWSWLMQAISAGVDGIQYGLEGYSTTVSSVQIEASGCSRL